MTNTTTCSGARCGRCHRVLKSPQAVEAGYGAVCYRKTFGGSLPGKGKPRAPKNNIGRGKSTAAGHSDFDCHLRTVGGRNIIVIEDLDTGGMSVTNNIETVVEEVVARLGIDLDTALIVYRDSGGIYYGVRAAIGDDRYGFYHLGQQDEDAAIKAALGARGADA